MHHCHADRWCVGNGMRVAPRRHATGLQQPPAPPFSSTIHLHATIWTHLWLEKGHCRSLSWEREGLQWHGASVVRMQRCWS